MKRLVITNYCILELQNRSLQNFGRQIQLRRMSEANSMSSDHGVQTRLLRQASYSKKLVCLLVCLYLS
jgi:hypothetical protein